MRKRMKVRRNLTRFKFNKWLVYSNRIIQVLKKRYHIKTINNEFD